VWGLTDGDNGGTDSRDEQLIKYLGQQVCHDMVHAISTLAHKQASLCG
jgi:hypothetical protein